MSLPPDRSWVLAEQRNPRTSNLHELSAAECVRVINREDRAVLEALERAGPALTAFIEAAEPGFLRGGRLVYLGAGTSGRLGVLDASEAPPTFQVPPGRIIGIIAGGDGALRKSSEGMEDDPRGAVVAIEALGLTPDDAVVGIAAGGTTPYVLGALEYVFSGSPSLREGAGGWAADQAKPGVHPAPSNALGTDKGASPVVLPTPRPPPGGRGSKAASHRVADVFADPQASRRGPSHRA